MPPSTYAFQITENVGTIPSLGRQGFFVSYENIGDTLPPLSSTAYFAVVENVGADLSLTAAPMLVTENVVSKPRHVGWGQPID